MPMYVCRVNVQGLCVFGNDVDAPDAKTASEFAKAEFLDGPSRLRAEIGGMDPLNQQTAMDMLVRMDETRRQADKFGFEVTARRKR